MLHGDKDFEVQRYELFRLVGVAAAGHGVPEGQGVPNMNQHLWNLLETFGGFLG